jgi:hypothetical protein
LDIIIDTNSIYEDLKLTGAKVRTLCETAKITGDTVYLPRIVIDEAKNKYLERLNTAKSQIDKELAGIKRLTGNIDYKTTYDHVNIKVEVESASKIFDDQVKKLEIEILPYPKTSHEVLAIKAVNKQKPFSESGKGYRDALIWENIKSLIRPSKKLIEEPQVILITANHKDFCENGITLHSDLRKEILKLNAPENSVEIISDFETFIKKYCNPKLKILNKLKQEFQEGKHKKLNVRNKVEHLVFSFLEHRQIDSDVLEFRQEFENPSVDSIHEDYKFNIDEVRQLSEKEILINGTVEVTCTFDVFIYKSDYYIMEEDETLSIWNYDWNDHYVAGNIDQKITLKVYLIIDTAFYDIASSEFEIINNKPREINSRRARRRSDL